jgi:hypothetical protein
MLALKHFFTFLPPERLEALAGRYQVEAAHSVTLSGPVLFLGLLNGLLNHPQLSQRLREETSHQQTGGTLDHSTFSYALNRVPPAYFAEVFGELHQKLQPQLTPGTQRALKVRRVDATTVTLSAKLLAWGLSGGTANPDKAHRHIKSVRELSEDGVPTLLRVCSHKSENADSIALGVPMKDHRQPGDLWVFDKGCQGRDRLRAIHKKQAFWLTPLSQQPVRVLQSVFVLPDDAWPTHVPASEEAPWVTTRVEQGVFENSQESAKTRQQWGEMPLLRGQGGRFDQRRPTWKPLTLRSNLPLSADNQQAGPYTWDERAAVSRSRWDIAVFFKFIKHPLNYSHLTSRSENGIKGMIHMSLIAALLLIWYKQQTGIDRGGRSVKFWLAEDVGYWTQELLQTVRWVDDD